MSNKNTEKLLNETLKYLKKHRKNMPKSFVYIFLGVILIFFCYLIYTNFNLSFDNNNINIYGKDKSILNNMSNNENQKNNTKTSNEDLSKEFTKAFVERIVDGDTIVVTTDDNTQHKVRFIGVNTPESTTKTEYFGKESSNYTKEKLLNKTVYLEKDVSNTDKYGRLLRYVWLEIPSDNSKENIQKYMFNAKLLLDGYARLATYPPDVKYVNYFKDMEKVARNENNGLWKKN